MPRSFRADEDVRRRPERRLVDERPVRNADRRALAHSPILSNGRAALRESLDRGMVVDAIGMNDGLNRAESVVAAATDGRERSQSDDALRN